MFLVSTRNFPPELGGMQNLMEGLSNALLDHGPVKVFADSNADSKKYDQNSNLSIERISGFKIFRKYSFCITAINSKVFSYTTTTIIRKEFNITIISMIYYR